MGATQKVIQWRGRRFNQRTIDMILEAERLLGHTLQISQGSYNNSVGASAGTHAGGGAVDFANTSTTVVRVLRSIGFAAWYRPKIAGLWGAHIHAIAIDDRDLSSAARGQVQQYYAGLNGLANRGPDTGPNVPKVTWEQYKNTQVLPPEGGTGLKVSDIWGYKNTKVNGKNDIYSLITTVFRWVTGKGVQSDVVNAKVALHRNAGVDYGKQTHSTLGSLAARANLLLHLIYYRSIAQDKKLDQILENQKLKVQPLAKSEQVVFAGDDPEEDKGDKADWEDDK